MLEYDQYIYYRTIMKTIASIILSIFILMQSIAGGGLGVQDSTGISDEWCVTAIMMMKTPLVSFFASTALPFRIVDEIIEKGTLLFPDFKKTTTPAPKKSSDTPSASQFWIMIVLNEYRSMLSAINTHSTPAFEIVSLSVLDVFSGHHQAQSPSHDPGSGLITIMVLAYLIILSRANLPAAYINHLWAVCFPNSSIKELGFLFQTGRPIC